MNTQENDGFQANSYQSDTIIQNNAQTHDTVHIWKFLDKLQLEWLEKHYNQQKYIQERAVNIGDPLVNIQDDHEWEQNMIAKDISNSHEEEELKSSISIGDKDYYVGINNSDHQRDYNVNQDLFHLGSLSTFNYYTFNQGQVLQDTQLDDQLSHTTEIRRLSEYDGIDDEYNLEIHSYYVDIERDIEADFSILILFYYRLLGNSAAFNYSISS